MVVPQMALVLNPQGAKHTRSFYENVLKVQIEAKQWYILFILYLTN